MTRLAAASIAAVTAAALATAAAAHPGGGGGFGGGMGGGMGMGHGMGGPGGGFGNGPGFGRSGLPSDNRPTVGTRTSTSVLDHGKLDASLSDALARSGVTVPGGDLRAACGGFRNLGQCVAALHVSKNLDLPGGFDALKGLTTGDNAVSLGKAIQQLQPASDAKAEERKANHQASDDLRQVDERTS